MKYMVVVEKGTNSWGAWVPDLPGCIAAGDSREEVEKLISEAIELHVGLMRAEGNEAPEPQHGAVFVEA